MGDVAREADSCVVSREFVFVQQQCVSVAAKVFHASQEVSDAYTCLCPAGGDNWAGMTQVNPICAITAPN